MSSTPPRVLVADADEEAHRRYAEALQAVDCVIVEAFEGRDALTKALVLPPALVITELRLPIVDGYALCEIIRQDRTTTEVPILVVTADARPASIDRARRAGVNAILIKPIDPLILGVEARRLIAAHTPSERVVTADDRASSEPEWTAALPATSKKQHMLSRVHRRFATTSPPTEPPKVNCPLCDQPLKYERSHVGGVNKHAAEQWDVFVCPTGCGRFEYRQRTRKVRRIP